MLVLSRKCHESIVIDDQITISVLAVHGKQVKLGISCPREVPVYRKELVEAIQRNAEPARYAGLLCVQ